MGRNSTPLVQMFILSVLEDEVALHPSLFGKGKHVVAIKTLIEDKFVDRVIPDVGLAVKTLKSQGVEFVESTRLHPEDRGALTRSTLGSVAFELVHQ